MPFSKEAFHCFCQVPGAITGESVSNQTQGMRFPGHAEYGYPGCKPEEGLLGHTYQAM